MQYYDIKAPILRGDKATHLLQPHHESMADEVEACEASFPDGLVLVTSQSPKSYKKAVEQIAWFFKREMRYDFRQYLASEYDGNCDFPAKTDADLRAFLWYEHENSDRSLNEWPMIGACGFRVKRAKKTRVWCLDWVWMHPFERRRGHLTKAWPFFTAMFADFALTLPVSPSMKRFLAKLGEEVTSQAPSVI